MRRRLAWLMAGWLFLVPATAQAGMCALCRQALESGGSKGLILGFYVSILLIGSMPLILAAVILWRIRRARRQRS